MRCWEETGIDVQAPGCRLTDWGLENHYDIWPQWRHRYAPDVSRNCERVFGFVRPCCGAVVLNPREHDVRFQWLPWLDAADLFFCLQCRSLPMVTAFVGGGWRLTLWPQPAIPGGTAVSVGAQTKFVEGSAGSGGGCSLSAPEVCTVPARPARKRCWAAMSLSAERARVRMTTHQVPFTVLPQDGLVGCYAAAFTQCVNFLLKGV